MKQFLYLDTDRINSIIAQDEKGLIEGISSAAVISPIIRSSLMPKEFWLLDSDQLHCKERYVHLKD